MIAVGTGLLLDVAAAGVFGAGAATDAFVAAARIPLGLTAIFMVLGNQVLVPTYATWSAALEPHRQRKLTSTVLIGALLFGAATACLLALIGDPLLWILAPGFSSEQHDIALSLLRVMVLTIPLTAAAEVLRAWLNARQMFVIPAAMTIVLNLTASGIIVFRQGDVSTLPLAYVVGALVQLIAMLGVALARGLRVARPTITDTEAVELLGLLTRPTLGASLNPLARAVETFCASFLPAGSVTILHYGNRLVSAVGGTVLFRSVMIAVLPRLTRAYAVGDRQAASRLTKLALRLMIATSMPLTAVACVLAVPATVAVFGIGRFTQQDARLLGLVFTVLALSFPASATQRALLAPFFAVRETRVPLRNTVYGVLANGALLPLFVLPFWGSRNAVLGVAAAYVVSQLVNVAHAVHRLRHSSLESSYERAVPWRRSLGSAVASGGLAATVYLLGRQVSPSPVSRANELALLAIACLLAVGAAVAVEMPNRGPTHTGLKPGDVVIEHRQQSRQQPAMSRPTRQRRSTPAMRFNSTLIVVSLVCADAVAVSAMAFASGWQQLLSILPLALLVGAGLVALAFNRFSSFVLATLALRTSLDALKLGGSAAVPDPAALLGILFIGVSVLWLVMDAKESGRLRPSPLAAALVGFVAVASLGILTSLQPLASLVEWTRMANICLMVLVVERLARRPRFRRQVVIAVAAAMVVPLTVSAVQLVTDTSLFDAGGFERIRGSFSHSNPLAAFLFLVTVLAWSLLVHDHSKRLRAMAVAMLLAALPALYLTYTRAAWLAVVLGMALVTLVLGRRAVLTFTVVAVIVVALLPGVGARFADLSQGSTIAGQPNNSLSWRLRYWEESTELVRDDVVTGIGLKQIAAETAESKQPHNDFLRAYVELGLAGIAAFAFLMWRILMMAGQSVRLARKLPRSLDKALLSAFAGTGAGYVVMSLVMNLMSQVVVGMYFFSLAAVAAAVIRQREPLPDRGRADEAGTQTQTLERFPQEV